MKPFNKYFDHTLLKADASETHILDLCRQAMEHDFASVCVNGCNVALCADTLADSSVKVAAVVGFPLGAMSTAAKVFEASQAINDGASEIDTVINIGHLKDGKYALIASELRQLADLCHSNGALLKVIIETCLLTDEEKIAACEVVTDSGADFIKTSTGFSTGGATEEDVKLMAANIGPDVKIKASGGIRTLDDANRFIKAGASRLGCSASVAIMAEYLK